MKTQIRRSAVRCARPGRSGRLGALALGSLAALTLLVPNAAAQRRADVQDESARWVAVKADSTALRCGDRERYYAVAELEAGTLLVADGQSEEWVRVRYPETVHPFVPADDARAAGGDAIELTSASGLRSPSMIMGPAGSWRSAIDPPLAAGTRLEIARVATDDAGATVGWYVVIPEDRTGRSYARGFIKRAAIRNATAVEVETFQARRDATPAEETNTATAAGDEPAETEPETTVADATPAEAELTDEAADDAMEKIAADQSLLDPMVPEGAETGTGDAVLDIVGKVDTGDEAPASDGTEPEEIAQGGTNADGTGDAEGAEPGEDIATDEPYLTPAALRDLEATFENARALPRQELDVALDELLAEYTRARDATDEEVVTTALDRRIEWIELRIETREQRRRLSSVLSEVSTRETMLAERVSTWRESRAFTIVGRLLPSRVYDGVRLPLMYRVESVEPMTYARTIGYIRPGEPDELAGRVGQILGFRGTAAFDGQLRMNIIEPIEVEALPNP